MYELVCWRVAEFALSSLSIPSVSRFPASKMNRQRSFSRKKGSASSSVAVALNSLLENVLCSLSMLKDQIEFVDDELFLLQTKSTAALPVTSRLDHLLRMSELFSFCVYACQKKLEELSVFAVFSKVEEQVLEPRQNGGAVSVVDEMCSFLMGFVFGSPVFLDLMLGLFPESADMLRVICNGEVKTREGVFNFSFGLEGRHVSFGVFVFGKLSRFRL